MDWLSGLLRRHKPEDAPTVKEAVKERDDLFVELDGAIREVDRVQGRVLADYRRANGLRRTGK